MRHLTCMLLVGLSACGTSVHTDKEAPFPIDDVRSALWSVEDDGDLLGDTALLLLSSEDLGCSVVAGVPYARAVHDATARGTGMILVFDQYTAEGELPGWEGSWTSVGAAIPSDERIDDGFRYVAAAGFVDGLVYDTPWEETHAEIDEVDDERVRGAFDAAWWSGSFRAERCGGFAADPATTTTGWY